ncbi:hypothetical protein SKAU_G00367370 [Synaphobranchus kaupii]|uniref:Fibroblast growth factor 11 n=1 Tax=Synaphobranchus kaupii TaxID=118154 RepID=A0A9Q1IFM2_SYNKA|nr:hypothetical protein SKAU_G00367370 [Synaphobranchus kaupii]
MAALASSLIRQRREVKDPQANRQVANKRKPCPKTNKSLCQKQILILISKVRLCSARGRRLEKRPVYLSVVKQITGRWRALLRPSCVLLSAAVIFNSYPLLHPNELLTDTK